MPEQLMYNVTLGCRCDSCVSMLIAHGSLLGACWGHLGGFLGHLGGILEASWGFLGHLGGILEASWGILGASLSYDRGFGMKSHSYTHIQQSKTSLLPSAPVYCHAKLLQVQCVPGISVFWF
jgi:hypothetical protein